MHRQNVVANIDHSRNSHRTVLLCKDRGVQRETAHSVRAHLFQSANQLLMGGTQLHALFISARAQGIALEIFTLYTSVGMDIACNSVTPYALSWHSRAVQCEYREWSMVCHYHALVQP